ncbi:MULTISPECIES: response regulator [unclassified Halomonas]|uniref:hybrid sensor histidine kinase/response regulator n=1 Tax=unclassified Halomonas TaxID=2609666 RepID=UPI0020767C3B|nr:response regulator [Halomonas sp. S3-1-8]
MAIDITRFIQRFVEEARDHQPRLREGITALAQGAEAGEINAMFRAVHTLKGSSRMLRLEAISALTHALEELLSALRDGTRAPDADALALLEQAADLLDTQIDLLAEGHPPESLPTPDAALHQALTTAASPGAPISMPATEPIPNAQALPTRLRLSDTVRVRMEQLDDLIRLMGEVLSNHHEQHALVERARTLGASLPAEHQRPLTTFHRAFKQSTQGQDSLMSELHDRALKLRMLPLAVVFDPLARMTRELAQTLGKEATCTLSGSDIELDRQMIDRLSEPLIHLLRNALDHGLESPEARRRAGKPPQGRVTLKAWQDGSGVVIELGDDGAGIDLNAVRQQALAKGLASAEQLTLASEQQLLELIFNPGFSTRSMITDMSGRGVGMDVVRRTVVDELSGDLRLEQRQGLGCTFTLRLPFSLALVRVLLFRVGGQTLGVTAPYVSSLTEVRLEQLIDTAGQRTLVHNDEFIPVVSLATLLELDETPSGERLLLMIVCQGTQKLALTIDTVLDERDMVIKPLPEHLGEIPLVSGMASAGGNALVSLLHVPALLSCVTKGAGRAPVVNAARPSAPRILIVDDSLNTREIEKDVLEAWGYHVILAENGQDGLDKALAEPFDAVLTDVEMPVMDGFTLTARLRDQERYRQVPIVIVTSREKEADRQRGMAVGADAYIVKGSFDQNHLVDTLKALLG